MTLRIRPVAVKQLPEILDAKHGRLFFRELESCLNVDRPCLVLDCSKVRRLDKSAVHLLLCCLEEAMKRNGDVKLAAIPAGASAVLELAGIERLFEVYASNAEAVSSFRRLPLDVNSVTGLSANAHRQSENAA
jgi:anti-anti-sigma regulatory factor